jgi:hypothetical protein
LVKSKSEEKEPRGGVFFGPPGDGTRKHILKILKKMAVSIFEDFEDVFLLCGPAQAAILTGLQKNHESTRERQHEKDKGFARSNATTGGTHLPPHLFSSFPDQRQMSLSDNVRQEKGEYQKTCACETHPQNPQKSARRSF